MPQTINITIDGKAIKTPIGVTILEVAKQNGIKIPSLCHHPDLKPGASCRVCLIEIKGQKTLQTACSTKAKEGMEITTSSPNIEKARRTNLELLFSQHKEECADCVWQYNCQLLTLARQHKVQINKFQDRKSAFPVYNFGNALQFDSSKCINCRNCLEVCANQEVRYLEIKEKDTFFEVFPSKTRGCIYCGQCLTHCPSGAFEAFGEFESTISAFNQEKSPKNSQKLFKMPGKTIVFQIAPSIRTSIGEDFAMAPGEITTEQIAAGLKKLGADKVFDVSVGADFTTFEEAKELLAKIKGQKNALLFSSCCPSWVRFVELYYPEFIPNIATTRPPHIILGGLIKSYWAKKAKIAPENIFVVSIMPCVAKKYEITRKEMGIADLSSDNKASRLSDTSTFPANLTPVDYVMTTRELARIFLKHKIDLKTITPKKLDAPFNAPSGSGVIYGASGGVMEAAIRAAAKSLDKDEQIRVDYEQIRGMNGLKTAKIALGDKEIRLAVVNGTGNAKKLLEAIKAQPGLYNCVEVMACPGGCIGGGGQPLPTYPETRRQRAQGLYEIDQNSNIKAAPENPVVKKTYKEFLTNGKIIKNICHIKKYEK